MEGEKKIPAMKCVIINVTQCQYEKMDERGEKRQKRGEKYMM